MPTLKELTGLDYGTSDDTRAINEALKAAKVEGAKLTEPDRFEVQFPTETLLVCEGTVSLDNARNIKIMGKGTISHTLGPKDPAAYRDLSKVYIGGYMPADQADAVGEARDRTYRNRYHWMFSGAQTRNVKVAPGFTIAGPHPNTGRAKSINSVLEAQHGVFFSGCGSDLTDDEIEEGAFSVQLWTVTIRNVWGDNTSQGTVEARPNELYTTGVEMRLCTFDRNGRAAFVTNGARHWKVYGGSVNRCAASVHDYEAGQSFDRNEHWLVQGLHVKDKTGIFAHLHGGSPLYDVMYKDNMFDGFMFNVVVAPDDRFRNLSWIGNMWNEPQDSVNARVSNFWRVDGLRLQYNSGPIYPTGFGAFDTSHDCTDVIKHPNNIWSVSS